MSHKRLPVSRRDFLCNAGSGLGAIAHDLKEFRVVRLAYDERIWLAWLSISNRLKFPRKSIPCSRVILEFDIHLHLLRPFLEVRDRANKLWCCL